MSWLAEPRHLEVSVIRRLGLSLAVAGVLTCAPAVAQADVVNDGSTPSYPAPPLTMWVSSTTIRTSPSGPSGTQVFLSNQIAPHLDGALRFSASTTKKFGQTDILVDGSALPASPSPFTTGTKDYIDPDTANWAEWTIGATKNSVGFFAVEGLIGSTSVGTQVIAVVKK